MCVYQYGSRLKLTVGKIENQEKTQEFLDKISKLRFDLESGTLDAETVEEQVASLESEVDETLISEEARRETVMAIVKQLKSQEFTVEKPQLVRTDGKNFVKIVAKQPSGKRAVCNVDLHGKIAYKFDNYAGMTCLKDIEKFFLFFRFRFGYNIINLFLHFSTNGFL